MLSPHHLFFPLPGPVCHPHQHGVQLPPSGSRRVRFLPCPLSLSCEVFQLHVHCVFLDARFLVTKCSCLGQYKCCIFLCRWFIPFVSCLFLFKSFNILQGYLSSPFCTSAASCYLNLCPAYVNRILLLCPTELTRFKAVAFCLWSGKSAFVLHTLESMGVFFFFTQVSRFSISPFDQWFVFTFTFFFSFSFTFSLYCGLSCISHFNFLFIPSLVTSVSESIMFSLILHTLLQPS